MSDSPSTSNKSEKVNMNKKERKRLFWKGKLVSEKVFNKRVQQTEVGKRLHIVGFDKQNPNLVNNEKVIMERQTPQKLCRKCKSVLSIEDLKEDQRYGLASKFDVECRHCHAVTTAWTD